MHTEHSESKETYRLNSATLRKKILEKSGYACVACGINNAEVPLDLAHLVPISQGGDFSEENLTVLCPNCHQSFDRQPKEIEFVSFLTDILMRHPDYSEVRQEVLLGQDVRYRADLMVKEQIHGRYESLLIECKTPRVFTATPLEKIIDQLKVYQTISKDSRIVLAIPATLREKHLAALRTVNIEVWDIGYLRTRFPEQIQQTPFNYYKVLLLAQLDRSPEPTQGQKLISSLASCQPGKAHQYVYQKIVGEILEYLFTPPLGNPIPELSDKSKANRRDFIMSNYADQGFWAFMRDKYQADYIVADAKNYSRKIKKSEVLQIANYLKSHGAGLFGIIITRKGGDTFGCDHTLREQWMVHRKLILIFDDDDIKEMIIAKLDGRPPEEVVGQRVEQFRLSM